MSTVIWTIFATAALIFVFAACIAGVVTGIRIFERLHPKKSAVKAP